MINKAFEEWQNGVVSDLASSCCDNRNYDWYHMQLKRTFEAGYNQAMKEVGDLKCENCQSFKIYNQCCYCSEFGGPDSFNFDKDFYCKYFEKKQ